MTRWPDLFVTLNLACLAVGYALGVLMGWGLRQWPRTPKLSPRAERVLARYGRKASR